MARYIPALRSKAGEAVALRNLTPAAKARMFPMVALAESPSPRFAPALSAAWTGLPLALDGQYNAHINGTASAFTSMFNALGKAGVDVIPTISMRSSSVYLNAASKSVGRYGQGAVVRCRLNELPQIGGWASNQGLNAQVVDLLVTLGDVSTQDPALYADFLEHTLQANIPNPPPWRSITIGGSSAPRDHGGLATGRNDVPRVEWQTWNILAPKLPFQIDYADSGPLYPGLEEPPGFVMARATVSARYAVDDDWIILKGRPTTGPHGQPMGTQYHTHARSLIRDPQFGGVAGCWADDIIRDIASGKSKPGSRQTWAGFSVNRHISLVADRLP